MSAETFAYSKHRVSVRAAAQSRREKNGVLISLLFVLVLVVSWSYQQVTGQSIIEAWDNLAATTPMPTFATSLLGLFIVWGIAVLFGAGDRSMDGE